MSDAAVVADRSDARAGRTCAVLEAAGWRVKRVAPELAALLGAVEEAAAALAVVAAEADDGALVGETLAALGGMTAVFAVGPADEATSAGWWRAGLREHLGGDGAVGEARLAAGAQAVLAAAQAARAEERLEALAALALEPPGRSGVTGRAAALAAGLGLGRWELAIRDQGTARRVAGAWSDDDGWPAEPAEEALRPMLGGPDVVVPVGTGEPPAGALRVRLEQDVDAAEAGFLRALGGLLGSGLPPGGGGAGDAPRGLTADAAAVHELRGPLTALLGQGQLIEHGLAGSADASVRAAARTIVEQARRLRALIDALDPR